MKSKQQLDFYSYSWRTASALSSIRSRLVRPTALRICLEKTARATLLFSSCCALFPKTAQLVENTSYNLFSNPFNFNHLRTLSHSFPGTPLFPICSPKHTGGIPPLTFRFAYPIDSTTQL